MSLLPLHASRPLTLERRYGWKQIHGDVFRPPSYPMLLSVFVGTGYQVATVTFFVIIFAIFG